MAIAGTYDVSVKTPMGDQQGSFTVVEAGGGFTGALASGMGNMEVVDGAIDGNRLTWKMDMKVPMPMTLDCEAVIDGDSLTGSVQAGAFGSMALTGTRSAG